MTDDYIDLLKNLASVRKLRSKVVNEINLRLQDLNSMEVLVISIIRKGPSGFTMSDLSEITGFSNATITSVVDSLEIRGLAKRTKGKDRRSYIVALTERGNEKAAQIEDLKKEIFKEFFRKMSKEDLLELRETLAKFSEIIDRYIQ
ncbi:MAG: MarR family transcriptional regulator [Candidatus Micrarchaeaceae archaeon]